VREDQITYYISDGYFIDIGIPEDYIKAFEELPYLFK
jgi:NDP-sugar pyrophosphorylase family protein